MRLLHRPAAALCSAFQPGIFNRVLALDAVYHFADKRAFFADAAALLPPGGTVGVTAPCTRDVINTVPRRSMTQTRFLFVTPAPCK